MQGGGRIWWIGVLVMRGLFLIHFLALIGVVDLSGIKFDGSLVGIGVCVGRFVVSLEAELKI